MDDDFCASICSHSRVYPLGGPHRSSIGRVNVPHGVSFFLVFGREPIPFDNPLSFYAPRCGERIHAHVYVRRSRLVLS